MTAELEQYEKQQGELKPGDIVVFRSGWSDKYLRPFPAGSSCMADPLNGKSEGWPAVPSTCRSRRRRLSRSMAVGCSFCGHPIRSKTSTPRYRC